MVQHRLVQGGLHLSIHCNGSLQGVVSLQDNIRLYYRHQALVLADQCIARKVLHVGVDCKICWASIGCDRKWAPPLGKLHAGRLVLLAPGSQRVKPLHHGVTTSTGQLIDLQVWLNTGDNAQPRQHLWKQDALIVLLVNGLRVQDCSAQVLIHAGSLVEHLPVDAPVLLSVLHTHSLKSSANSTRTLVSCGDSFAGRTNCLNNRLEPDFPFGREVLPAVTWPPHCLQCNCMGLAPLLVPAVAHCGRAKDKQCCTDGAGTHAGKD
mmetsp:Transcript_29775/g.85251  ORF Transcript_29775/g.85251 Transcript_29775/m.85251 type:complete len:264 (-) Transcript_29775:178-969(-)